MKIVKPLLICAAALAMFVVAAYFYFDKKFSPPPNKLLVDGQSIEVPFRWGRDAENPYSAMLIPVSMAGIGYPLYMQVDFGAPTTVFYRNSLASMQVSSSGLFNSKNLDHDFAAEFKIGGMGVKSPAFTSINYGGPINLDPGAINIIGTIGADLLEKKAAILDFQRNTLSFVDQLPTGSLSSFEFKKRRVLMPGKINGAPATLLYDSGTSGYELITTQEKWNAMRSPGGSIKKEKGNSWGKVLAVYSAPAQGEMEIAGTVLPLHEVTYVDGMPAIQKFLIKKSGMQGMVGNKIFLGHRLLLDARSTQFRVE